MLQEGSDRISDDVPDTTLWHKNFQEDMSDTVFKNRPDGYWWQQMLQKGSDKGTWVMWPEAQERSKLDLKVMWPDTQEFTDFKIIVIFMPCDKSI